MVLAVLLSTTAAAAAELVPRGVFHWSGQDDGFGGFSGLAMAADGAAFHTVSDGGEMREARVSRDGSGRITAIGTVWTGRMRDNFGKPVEGFTADAEALARDDAGRLVVAFESYARIAAFTPPDMTPEALSEWDRFRDLWGNEGFESVAIAPDGGLIVVIEEPRKKRYATFVAVDGGWAEGPSLPAPDGFSASDAAYGPDGWFYLLERRFAYSSGFVTRIRRFRPVADGFDAGEELLRTKPGELDNMEGISLWRDASGRVFVSLISDDNFLPFQRTILAEYELRE